MARPEGREGGSRSGFARPGQGMRSRPQERRPESPEAHSDRFADHDEAPRRAPLPPATRTQPGDIPLVKSQPQPVAAHAEGMRLNKRMAELGLCSRREADEWIARGWVLVNGQRAETGQRVGPDDSINVDQAA